MIERYSLPEIAEIFSDRSKFARYLEIELLATEAKADIVLEKPINLNVLNNHIIELIKKTKR